MSFGAVSSRSPSEEHTGWIGFCPRLFPGMQAGWAHHNQEIDINYILYSLEISLLSLILPYIQPMCTRNLYTDIRSPLLNAASSVVLRLLHFYEKYTSFQEILYSDI